MNNYKKIFLLFFLSLITCWVFPDEMLSNELIKEYKNTLNELLDALKDTPDDIQILREIGKVYFYLGELTTDLSYTSKATKIFKKILKVDPNDAEIKVYYGSSYTLKARDFPLKWLVSLTPLGFVRIYYVNKGIELMDQAVKMQPDNPLVLIVRATTCVNLPKVFGQFNKGMQDFSLLISWIERPDLCPKYKDLLLDASFKSVVYYNFAEQLLKENQVNKAKELLTKMQEFTVDSYYKSASKRLLEKIQVYEKR